MGMKRFALPTEKWTAVHMFCIFVYMVTETYGKLSEEIDHYLFDVIL